MGIIKYITAATIMVLTLISCDTSKSLQAYLVDKQEDDRFLKVDLATSLLQTERANFTQEQKDILNTVKKINVVAYPFKNADEAEYELERSRIKEILDQEKYEDLMTMKSNNVNMNLKYLGTEDAIDEVIIFANDKERGFGVFRLLCDNMNPDQMLKLAMTIKNGDLDLTKLSGIESMFKEMDNDI